MATTRRMYTLSWAALRRLPDHLREQIVPVRISVGMPRGWKGAGEFDVIHMLTPGALFRQSLPKPEFREAYRARLDEFGVEKIEEVINAVHKSNDEKPLVLLCFEGKPEDCHRSQFAEWWEEKTGEEIPELETGQLTI